MKRNVLALLCAFSLLLQGCSSNTNNPEKQETNIASASSEQADDAEDVQTDDSDSNESADNSGVSIRYELVSKSFSAKDGTELLNADYYRPTIIIPGNEAATEAIADFFTEHEEKFWESAKSYLKDADLMYDELKDNFLSYYISMNFESFRIDDAILSIRCQNNDFTGGPHGNYNYTGINFDIQTGVLLRISTIASDKDALLDSAHTYIESQLKLPIYAEQLLVDPENLRQTIQDFVLKDDFWYFTNSGLTFVSNTSILAPYAVGAYFFTVPYQQLEGLKPEYQYIGPYELSGPIGSTLSADLDGDENIEAIYYNAAYDEETYELSFTLIISGTDYSSCLQNDACRLTAGALGMDGLEYYLIDLDTSDNYIEIAFQDMGDSNDLNTYFFRYERGELTLLGNIADLLSNPSFHTYGDGTLTADVPLTLLESLAIPVHYELTDRDEFAVIPEEWYYPKRDGYEDKYINHEILQDVTVYLEKDLHSDTVTLTPDSGPVQFPAADNEHWVMLKTASGDTYYVYLTDFMTLESGQITCDVFENLILSD